jgi:hypothetical protein
MSLITGAVSDYQSNGGILANANAQSVGIGQNAGGVLTGTYPNPTLAPTGVTAGTYGDNMHVAQVTVNAGGQVTNATNVAIASGVPSPGASGNLLTSDGTNWTSAAPLLPAPGTNGNVLTSNGSAWTSGAPSLPAGSVTTTMLATPSNSGNQTVGSANQVPVIVYNDKGQIISAINTAVNPAQIASIPVTSSVPLQPLGFGPSAALKYGPSNNVTYYMSGGLFPAGNSQIANFQTSSLNSVYVTVYLCIQDKIGPSLGFLGSGFYHFEAFFYNNAGVWTRQGQNQFIYNLTGTLAGSTLDIDTSGSGTGNCSVIFGQGASTPTYLLYSMQMNVVYC